jgi:hypothetical protein
MFVIYLCNILILIFGLIVKIFVLAPVLWSIFFKIFIFVNLEFRYLHVHFVIIFLDHFLCIIRVYKYVYHQFEGINYAAVNSVVGLAC